jgi:RNA polymerase sigma-70 factor, ECF subfamily
MSARDDRTAGSDEDLVRCFQRTGATEPLNELVSRHLGTVRRMVYAMVLNDADADDLSQEILVRALQALPRFEHRSRFSTWLYRIAMNVTRSFLATRARSPLQPADPLPESGDPATPRPDGRLLNHELDAEIAAALAELPPKLRAALVLTAIQGLGVAEAARIERCVVPTLYWRIHQARKQLHKRLARYLNP